MNKIFLCLFHILCFLLFFFSKLNAQEIVTGIVVDEQGNPLQSVIVKQLDSITNKFVGYTSSKADGSFSIKAYPKNFLDFSLLGYERQTICVMPGMLSQTVIMKEKSVELKGAVVKADKVREKGDTLSYLVGAYANSNDRSIGDVMSRMPGIEVDSESGKITYNGKSISKFYIDGLDMLGSKYGVATNSIPQQEVGSVEVVRNHQPIRVLDSFTYPDDVAINIKMKDGARSRWIMTYKCGAGANSENLLGAFEGFGLRIKPEYQSMITLKANNTGKNVLAEISDLFSFDDDLITKHYDYISLSRPSASNVSSNRQRDNITYVLTANAMKRLGDCSQISTQLTYSNNEEKAYGEFVQQYYLPDSIKTISRLQDWQANQSRVYAKINIEHNSENSYLKNSVSGDLSWNKQRIDECGNNSVLQKTNVPLFDIRDNLYMIRRYGKTLVSLYSNNTFKSLPHELFIGDLTQYVGQKYFATDSYATGAVKLGDVKLGFDLGVKGMFRNFTTNAFGLSENIGNTSEDYNLGLAELYFNPNFEYNTHSIRISLDLPVSNVMYWSSKDSSKDYFHFSPNVKVRWLMTSRFEARFGGGYDMNIFDYSKHYGAIIMQDYINLTKGCSGFEESTSKSLYASLKYHNAIKGTKVDLQVMRTFDTDPYIMERSFVGSYILHEFANLETLSNMWNINLVANQGLSFLNSNLNLNVNYTFHDSNMIQEGTVSTSSINNLSSTMSYFAAPTQNMSISYKLRFSYNDMVIDKQEDSRSSFVDWRHELSVTIPLNKFRIGFTEEYDHNQVYENYKDMFFSDLSMMYKFKHFDISMKLNNIFNNKEYCCTAFGNLMSSSSLVKLRGREILFTLYYKL